VPPHFVRNCDAPKCGGHRHFYGGWGSPKLAIEKYLSQPEYEGIKIIAVTFLYGQKFKGYEDRPEATQISAEYREFFKTHNGPIVRTHPPFNPIHPHLEGAKCTETRSYAHRQYAEYLLR